MQGWQLLHGFGHERGREGEKIERERRRKEKQ